jgi:DNA repair protein RadC
MSKLSIKQWAEEDRPREKLLLKGVSALSDSELLAILIGSGNDKQSAVELSKEILLEAGNDLNRLARMGVTDLVNNFRGIGHAKAVTIIAALELGRRRKTTGEPRKKIVTSMDAYEQFLPLLGDLNHEETWALLTDRSNQVISTLQVSRGGIAGTVVDIRLILREALTRYATGIFLGHNHPSGNLAPSPQDISITKKLKEAYFSFADEGVL